LRNLFDVPLAGSTMKNSLIPAHHILANHINTWITGDYVKLIKSNYIHYFVIILILTFAFIRIDSRLKLFLFLLFQFIIIMIQTLVYAGTSIYIDFTTTYIMLIFLQYILVPLIAFVIFKEQKVKQLEIINNARIDALLLISEKVAHDIHSPLSAMNLLLKKVTFQNDEQKNIFTNSVQKIELITQNLLTKYKADTKGEKLIDAEQFSINNMINEVLFEKRTVGPLVDYILNTDRDIIIQSNKLELSRILSNILDNSIHALTEQTNPKITISVSTTSDSVKIEVIDNGIGIPDSLIKIIGTKRFSSKSSGKGSGIGLLHAKRSIEEMRGIFEVNSKPGEYTKVSIKLPIHIS
jgi:signal transduction histidine kinase